jgi:hypothetical protein
VGAARHGTACQCQAPPHSKGIVSTYYEVPGMTRVRRAGTYSTAFGHWPLPTLEGRPPPPRGSAPPTARPGPARPDTSRDRGRDGTGRLPTPETSPHAPPATGSRCRRLRGPPAKSAFFSKLPSTPHTQRAAAAAAGGDPLGRAAGMRPRLQLRRGDRDSLRRQPHGTVECRPRALLSA